MRRQVLAKELLQVRLGPPLLILFGALVMLAGAWATLQEFRQFQSTPLTASPEAILGGLVDGSIQPGLSMDSFRVYGDACMRVVPRLEARFQSGETATALDHACVDVVRSFAEATPVNGFAWLTLAFAGYYRNDAASLNLGLQRSQTSSGNESWLVQRRAELGERAIALLEPRVLEGHARDLAVLATTTTGSRWLATQYVLNTRVRSRLTEVMERLTVAQQGMFLSNVQLLTRREGGT